MATVALSLGGGIPAWASVVVVEQDPGGHWHLRRDGELFAIRGVGGTDHLDLAASIGANTIRTWGVDQIEQTVDGRPLLDRAHALGLAVVVGLWVEHERHGFDYNDPVRVQRQRDEVRAAVRKYRNHPAVLLWGLGNEMEGPTARAGEPRIWRELDALARIIKEEDPHHPVMTVLSNADPAKLRAIREFYPSLDILGVNLYGGAPRLPALLDEAGWTGPFMLTEFGSPGDWEVSRSDWRAPIEPTTKEKLAAYVLAHRTSTDDPAGRCLGTFCFYWGQKQETTATWFNMFLRTGEKTPLVDAMGFEFSGRWPVNRSPLVTHLVAPFANRREKPGSVAEVEAVVVDPENDPLKFEWLVVAESVDHQGGGDPEAAPPAFPECTLEPSGSHVRLRLPERAGAYRLFLTVRDGAGGGCTENVTFFIE